MHNLFFYQEIDKEALDAIESFLNQVSLLCDKHKDKALNEWLDSKDVCSILDIQPRTLQAYRNNGKIGFSQIDHKIFYRPCDVVKILNSNNFKHKNKKIIAEVTKSNNRVANLHLLIENIKSKIEETFSNYKPLFNGERYLTDSQLSKRLNISRRTLQTYRDKGILSYILLEGKILYKESDVENLLEKNYLKAWKED